MSDRVRVALIQARPVYYDLARTVAKALSLISEAARQGARLAAFPETFFPGYPAWLDYAVDYARWDHPPTKATLRPPRCQQLGDRQPRDAAAA